MRTFFLWGAVNAFLAVALGAFGAHQLKEHISPEMIAIWNTGAQYQMYHGLALLLVAALFDRLSVPAQNLAQKAGYLFTAGCVIFAGSLYALAVSGVRVLGAITPLGGLCFLSGWVLLALAAVKPAPEPQR